MAYEYYQNERRRGGWGSKIGRPPMPNIRPQPNWRGEDYYIAQAYNRDVHFFHELLNLVYDTRGTGGYDHTVAKQWHRTVYGGNTSITRTLPRDIGAAAAYEAYRVWKHYRSQMYPFNDNDRDNEREALIGLAAAEASNLWRYTGRGADNYGLREAMESAVLTAYGVSSRVIGGGIFGGMFAGHSSSRRSSVSSGMLGDDYGRGYQRHRRHSSLGTAPMMMGRASSSSPYVNTIPLAGSHGSPYTHTVSLAGSNPISIPSHHGSSYGGGYTSSRRGSYGNIAFPGSYSGSSYHEGSYGAGATVIPVGAGYGGSSYAQPVTIQSSRFPGGAVTLPPVAPGSTIVIHGNKRSRHGSVSSQKRGHVSHYRTHSSGKSVGFL